MPTNLYGPGDNFHAEDSHVLPALIRRFHDAMIHGQPSVTIWGSGDPLREFLHVDDLASACLHLMALPREELNKLVTPQRSHLNVGSGEEVRIGHLATMVAEAVGYEGHIAFDTSRPDGTPRKLLDSSKLRHLGWQPSISLQEGIERTVQHYLAAHAISPMDLASRGYVERPQLRL
jgi:GDP-L-fucose synthase